MRDSEVSVSVAPNGARAADAVLLDPNKVAPDVRSDDGLRSEKNPFSLINALHTGCLRETCVLSADSKSHAMPTALHGVDSVKVVDLTGAG